VQFFILWYSFVVKDKEDESRGEKFLKWIAEGEIVTS
jgi:hypothetical protein